MRLNIEIARGYCKIKAIDMLQAEKPKKRVESSTLYSNPCLKLEFYNAKFPIQVIKHKYKLEKKLGSIGPHPWVICSLETKFYIQKEKHKIKNHQKARQVYKLNR